MISQVMGSSWVTRRRCDRIPASACPSKPSRRRPLWVLGIRTHFHWTQAHFHWAPSRPLFTLSRHLIMQMRSIIRSRAALTGRGRCTAWVDGTAGRASCCNPVHSSVLKETSSHFELVNTEDKTMAETQTVSFVSKFWTVLQCTWQWAWENTSRFPVPRSQSRACVCVCVYCRLCSLTLFPCCLMKFQGPLRRVNSSARSVPLVAPAGSNQSWG